MPTVKWFLGQPGAQIVKYGLDHGGRKILAPESISAAHDDRGLAPFLENRAHILIEGFSQGPGGLASCPARRFFWPWPAGPLKSVLCEKGR